MLHVCADSTFFLSYGDATITRVCCWMLPLSCSTWPNTAPSRSSRLQHHPSPLNPTHGIDLWHGKARKAGKFRNGSKGATPGIQNESIQPQKPLRIKLNVCILITFNLFFSVLQVRTIVKTCNTLPRLMGNSGDTQKKFKEKKILETSQTTQKKLQRADWSNCEATSFLKPW